MFVSASDSLDTRVFQWWQLTQSWVYSRIVLKEDTYELIDWVYTPRQRVWVTHYYRITYSHDTTPPVCVQEFLSHDELWRSTFTLENNAWFSVYKYWFFLCEDQESWCICEDDACFERDGRVVSSPKIIPHNSTITHTFHNSVWLESTCSLSDNNKIFYDTQAPAVIIYNWEDRLEDIFSKEYVTIDGLRYDENDIPGKLYFSYRETLELKADKNRDLSLEFIDALKDSTEWVSGISDIYIRLFELSDNSVRELGDFTKSYEPFNIDGTIVEQDIKQLSLSEISSFQKSFTQVGVYKLYVSVKDFAWNDTRVSLTYRILPWEIDPTRVIVEVDERHTRYADFQEYYRYELTLRDTYWNIIPNAEIFQLQHNCWDLLNCKWLSQNMTWEYPSWVAAINIFDITNRSDENGVISFSLRSFAPGIFTESFSFQIFIENDISELFISGSENTFRNVVTGRLLAEIDGIWQDTLPIWEISNYLIELERLRDISWNINISDNFTSFIVTNNPSANFTMSGSLQVTWEYISFRWIYDTSLPEDSHQSLKLQITNDNRSPIIINYTIAWYRVETFLSNSETDNQALSLWINISDIEPLRIIWLDNFSINDNTIFSDSDIRNILRGEVLRTLRSRTHGTIVWRVLYIDGTRINGDIYRLQGNPNYRTIIVRDANILIESDFNIWWAPVWIIAIKSTWYSVDDGYRDVWNIYINSNVSQIHAMMYADGAIVSTHGWEIISSQSPERNSQLSQQLYIKWSIFSRNTVWWSTEQDWQYRLPGWRGSDNQDVAVQYDFEKLRRWNNNCIQIEGVCRFPNYTIIEYDNRILSSPPPFFNR